MSSIIRNGSAQAFLNGVNDQSVPPLVQLPIGTPIHLPLSFSFAPEGPENEAHVVSGDSMFKLYGLDITDATSPYATINTPFIDMFNKNANEQMIHRLVPDDAALSTLRLYVETVVVDDAPIYERGADGAILLDAQGVPKTTGTGDGIKAVWRIAVITDEFGGFGKGSVIDGTLVGKAGVTSKIYPVLDIPASARGVSYDNYGIRLECLNELSATPVSKEMVESVGARLYAIQLVSREDAFSTATPIRTLDGAAAVNFSFMRNAYYKPLRLDLDYRKVLMKSYRNINPKPGYTPVHGPIREFFLYDNNLATVQGQFKVALKDLVKAPMIDIFTGLDNEGISYDGVVIDDGTEGGEALTLRNSHWLADGSDGTMDNATFDTLVRREMDLFGEGSVNYLNVLRYPCRFIWDAGYTVDTKAALTNFMGRRKDTVCLLSTHVFDQGVNDIATENSMKIALQGMLLNHPESVKFATSALRGMVVGHSMLLNDSQYDERVPALYSLANLTSLYAGAGEGTFKSQYRFSRGELARITEGADLNLTYKPRSTYESDWDTGLINIQSYDQYSYFFPALYTVYPNDRSILNGYIVAVVCADLEFLATQTWAEMSGASDLSDGQLVEMLNRKIVQKTNGRYDGVVQVVPNAYFTDSDKSNGYSVTVDINLYGNVIKTVHKYTIVAHRQEG